MHHDGPGRLAGSSQQGQSLERPAAQGLEAEGRRIGGIEGRLDDLACLVGQDDGGSGGTHGEGHLFNGPLQEFRRRHSLGSGLSGGQECFGTSSRGPFGLEESRMIDGHRRLAGDGFDELLVLRAKGLLG